MRVGHSFSNIMTSKHYQKSVDCQIDCCEILQFAESTDTKPVPPLLNVLLARENCACGVVMQRGGSPWSDHRTPIDESDVFHVLDGQSYVPCLVGPVDHMSSDVFLEYLAFSRWPPWGSDKSAVRPGHLYVTPLALGEYKSSEAVQDRTMYDSMFG